PDGNIWFVMSTISCPLRSGCTTAGWIGRMTIDGSSVTSFSTGNLVPRNLVTGADGNLWFPLIAEVAPFPPGAGLLASITTSGVTTQLPLALATPGRLPEDLTHMTVAPDGNFWVSSLSSNRLFRITPSGTMTAFPLADFDTGANSSQYNYSAYPFGIAAASDGTIWFTEQRSNKIGRIAGNVAPAGHVNLFWRNGQDGGFGPWSLDSTTIRSEVSLSAGVNWQWQVTAIGDPDGNGTPDVLWRHTQTGHVAAWLMDGVSVTANPIVSAGVPLAWQIAGLGDLDGDGKADIV